MSSLHFKIFVLLSVALIINISFVILSYQFLENDVDERSGVLISMKYEYDISEGMSASNDNTNDRDKDKDNDRDNDNDGKIATPFKNNLSDSNTTVPVGATTGADERNNGNNSSVWLAGIILDTASIQEQVWKSIIHLNCQHNVGIHIIAKRNVENGLKKRDALYDSYSLEYPHPHSKCMPFIIYNQEDDQLLARSMEAVDNRIDRISLLRDYQRHILRKDMFSDDMKNIQHHGAIILADLDLFQFPSIDLIVDQLKLMKDPSYPHDAICAIGTTLHFDKGKRKPLPFYYDTYATVFLPDTFSHPLSRRLLPHLYHGEDPRLVRSNDQVHGNFTQADIWKYFMAKGNQHKSTGNVPVRSCFGGFALYRSNVYFKEGCQYKLKEDIIHQHQTATDTEIDHSTTTILRYASNKEKRPCEHIVFHDCLAREQPKFAIAVNPNLGTIWKRDKK